MPSRIDHVIIAGPDLAALEDSFTKLGFYVTGGGEHPHLGTRNRIIVLDEGYIELLAIADPERVSPTLTDFIARGGGWLGYALQSADIAAETASMVLRGVDARGPYAGQLVAPDGAARSWRVVTIGTDDLWQAAFPVPFLIQHDSTGSVHRRELAGEGGLRPHHNVASHLMSVRISDPDVAQLVEQYKTAYELTGTITRTTWEDEENLNASLPLTSGEAIHFSQAPTRSMSIRVRVNRPEVIEELHWPTLVTMSRTARTYIVTLPGVKAEIEFTSSR